MLGAGSARTRAFDEVVLRLSLVVVLMAVLWPPSPARAQLPPEQNSPPGQVYVWTVNTRQQIPVDLKAFRRLFELVKAVRARPRAFDGGVNDATALPDVMVFNEMRHANLEIFRRLLLQRSQFRYEIVSAEGAEDKFLYNSNTMTQQGAPQTVVDPCRSSGDNARQYLVARFTENATGSPLTVAGVHLKAKYNETGQPQCRERNIQAVKTALTADVGALVIAGDFNKRPVEVEAACDPDERSAPLEWYTMLTDPSDLSRAFVDTVREAHRAQGESMADEWTFERLTKATLCNGTKAYKRSRLDYIFASGATVADAHTDHPGWAGDEPGNVPFGKGRYSDHRWVWARLVLSGPGRPSSPTLDLGPNGSVGVTWEPVDGATTYTIYRAKRWHAFNKVAEIPADQTTYVDTGDHGIPYKYAVAATGADSGQGRESPGRRAIPDARGPHVTATNPPSGAPRVSRRERIRVWFGEGVHQDSVDESTITVLRKGHSVPGRVIRESSRQVVFNPAGRLRAGSRFFVIVRGVQDRLGNRGPRYTFSFATPEPPKKDRKRR